MTKPKHVWMVRAGNDNELADLVEEKNVVAIGWCEMGDVSDLVSREEFKKRYREVYEGHSKGRVAVNAGQVYRFVREIHEGDYALTYIKASRDVLIGVVEGQYEHRAAPFLGDYAHVRRVKWFKKVSRDDFGARARNSMGSTLTVFGLDDHVE